MKCLIKVEFNEQSKSVVSNTKVELEHDVNSREDILNLKQQALEIGRSLFDEAYAFAKHKSLSK